MMARRERATEMDRQDRYDDDYTGIGLMEDGMSVTDDEMPETKKKKKGPKKNAKHKMGPESIGQKIGMEDVNISSGLAGRMNGM